MLDICFFVAAAVMIFGVIFSMYYNYKADKALISIINLSGEMIDIFERRIDICVERLNELEAKYVKIMEENNQRYGKN